MMIQTDFPHLDFYISQPKMANLFEAAFYCVILAAGAIIHCPDVIPDDPFGQIFSIFHVLVLYVILIFGLMLMLISVVFPGEIVSTKLLKKLALMGLPLIAAAAAVAIEKSPSVTKEQGMCMAVYTVRNASGIETGVCMFV